MYVFISVYESFCVCGDMEEARTRGLYRLLALNTKGDEPAEPARNLKAHQASSGTAGRRVSDFISSFSRLGRKITVIKKPDKYRLLHLRFLCVSVCVCVGGQILAVPSSLRRLRSVRPFFRDPLAPLCALSTTVITASLPRWRIDLMRKVARRNETEPRPNRKVIQQLGPLGSGVPFH